MNKAPTDNARRKRHLQAIHEVIRAHRERERGEIQRVHAGVKFLLPKDVFSPFLAPSGAAGFAVSGLPVYYNARVLEIGCGAGLWTTLAAKNGAKQVVGIDVNARAVEAATKNAARAKVKSKVTITCADITKDAHFLDGSFDIMYVDLPFTDHAALDMLQRAFFDPGLQAMRRAMDIVNKHLSWSARVPESSCAPTAFVVASDDDPLAIDQLARAQDLKARKFMTLERPMPPADLGSAERISMTVYGVSRR